MLISSVLFKCIVVLVARYASAATLNDDSSSFSSDECNLNPLDMSRVTTSPLFGNDGVHDSDNEVIYNLENSIIANNTTNNNGSIILNDTEEIEDDESFVLGNTGAGESFVLGNSGVGESFVLGKTGSVVSLDENHGEFAYETIKGSAVLTSCVDPKNFTIVYENSDYLHLTEEVHDFKNHKHPAFLVTLQDLVRNRLDFVKTCERNRDKKKRIINLVWKLVEEDLGLFERADEEKVLVKMVSRIKKAFKSNCEDISLRFVYADSEFPESLVEKFTQADLKLIAPKTRISHPDEIEDADLDGIVFVKNDDFKASDLRRLRTKILSYSSSTAAPETHKLATSMYRCLGVEHGKKKSEYESESESESESSKSESKSKSSKWKSEIKLSKSKSESKSSKSKSESKSKSKKVITIYEVNNEVDEGVDEELGKEVVDSDQN